LLARTRLDHIVAQVRQQHVGRAHPHERLVIDEKRAQSRPDRFQQPASLTSPKRDQD
jgi:hypothetical protein